MSVLPISIVENNGDVLKLKESWTKYGSSNIRVHKFVYEKRTVETYIGSYPLIYSKEVMVWKD